MASIRRLFTHSLTQKCLFFHRYLFAAAVNFNQPLDLWDTSNVEDMTGMFILAELFNQEISDWDVSSVVKMDGMARSEPHARAVPHDMSLANFLTRAPRSHIRSPVHCKPWIQQWGSEQPTARNRQQTPHLGHLECDVNARAISICRHVQSRHQ